MRCRGHLEDTWGDPRLALLKWYGLDHRIFYYINSMIVWLLIAVNTIVAIIAIVTRFTMYICLIV